MTNYVHDRATTTMKTVDAALLDVVGDVVAAVNRARVILQGEKERETWESFIRGYAHFHFASGRYRLFDLTGSEYI